MEETNTPAVALVNAGFLEDARTSASAKGMPGIRIVPETVPCESSVMEQIEAGVNAVMDSVIAALTRPLTAEEKSPQPVVEKPPRIVFQGNLKEANRFFYKRGWTDGQPVIPPTEEEVAEMLTGTDLPPDHLVAELGPRLGKATVERIAINAVMAGALPTYMPLLIAGVQALMDPKAAFGTYAISAGSWAPFWIMNGPIRNELHVNGGSGALSPGDIANAAIGRAIGLIIKNVGGIRKGIEDMGTLGNPGKYSLVIAENEEDNPWEPLHVEHGFNRDDNTITVFFPNNSVQVGPYGTDDAGILRTVIYNLIPGRRKGRFLLILIPSHAKTLAASGWTKKDIQAFIAEYGRVPADHLPSFWGGGIRDRERGLHKERVPMVASDSVSVLDAELIRVIVAGGAGASIGAYIGGGAVDPGWVTKRVELPAHWDNLVKKYKDIVPMYVRY
ncbi:MAG: hypothetical protein HY667_01230 [Chloroflexi bacterium]|nr:hypothetical protein [Chloroflexota bacterium]